LDYDQLLRERTLGNAFAGFREGSISFMPTFKYDTGSDRFDSSSKERPPAWTDRVLYSIHEEKKKGEKNMGKDGTITSDGDGVDISKPPIVTMLGKKTTGDKAVTYRNKGSELDKEDVVTAIKIPSLRRPFLELKRYTSIDSKHSDHRPVSASFVVNL
jgi:hypothetical protein